MAEQAASRSGSTLRWSPNGATAVAAVIGDPVAHSLSPVIHNAAFAELGLDWVFVALPVPDGRAGVAVDGARALGVRGLSVTMPHKHDVVAVVDGLTSSASALGAVNCIVRAPHDDDLLLGDNTDGEGFLRGLSSDFGLSADDLRCVVLGAGGAGRAVAHALGAAGASSVVVVNRDPDRGRLAAGLAGPAGSFLHSDDRGVPDAVGNADLLVNATPVGMSDVEAGGDRLLIAEDLIREDLVVAELVYHPRETRLMAAARKRGARTSNGLSMLVHQAAVAFEHWTGLDAPVAVMAAAVGVQVPGDG